MKKDTNANKKSRRKRTQVFDMENFEINNMIISNTMASASMASDYRMQIELGIFAS